MTLSLLWEKYRAVHPDDYGYSRFCDLHRRWTGRLLRDRAETNMPDTKVHFTSNILPKWARRSMSLDALFPVLYLNGISTGDFQDALSAILGADEPNLSPGVVSRLTAGWQAKYDAWSWRGLSARQYVLYLGELCLSLDDAHHQAVRHDHPELGGDHIKPFDRPSLEPIGRWHHRLHQSWPSRRSRTGKACWLAQSRAQPFSRLFDTSWGYKPSQPEFETPVQAVST